MSDKPKLTVIEKPEGFDLRHRRMLSQEDASKWTPEDVLYHVAQEIKDKPVSDLIVVWRENVDDESYYTRSRRATRTRSDSAEMLLNAIGTIMGWRQ